MQEFSAHRSGRHRSPVPDPENPAIGCHPVFGTFRSPRGRLDLAERGTDAPTPACRPVRLQSRRSVVLPGPHPVPIHGQTTGLWGSAGRSRRHVPASVPAAPLQRKRFRGKGNRTRTSSDHGNSPRFSRPISVGTAQFRRLPKRCGLGRDTLNWSQTTQKILYSRHLTIALRACHQFPNSHLPRSLHRKAGPCAWSAGCGPGVTRPSPLRVSRTEGWQTARR